MKSAFAKLLQTNPTQSSHVVFGPGGNDVPILTRASGQSTTGYQTMGLPGANTPFPGGGANKTVLGAYRMGEDDGVGPGSAIYPGDIFPPIPSAGRVYPTRTFEIVGNNVYQPESDDKATYALLKRLGDQKFKAESKAPFEDYMAKERLARDLQEASRNGSLSDLEASREIMRNLSEQRRQQSENDYLRRMLDAGMTTEAANKEIENVRNANALQEAKRVDDRPYQAKLLISRLASSRGVTSMVREPLSQSASVNNPDRSQAMAEAMGVGGGFGTAPLDASRQFMTPDFYRRFLRRSTLTQEAGDEQQAFNELIASNQLPTPPTGSFSMATLSGLERQGQIETASEALASRLENIRQRAFRIKLPLPANPIFKDTLNALYNRKNKKPEAEVLFSPETIQDLRPLQTLVAINLIVQTKPNGFDKLRQQLSKYSFGSPDRPRADLFDILKMIAVELNQSQDIRIPFVSEIAPVDTKKVVDEINMIKTGSPALRAEVEKSKALYDRLMKAQKAGELSAPEPVVADEVLPEEASGGGGRSGASSIVSMPLPMPKRGGGGGGGGGGAVPDFIQPPLPTKTALNKMSAGDLESLMIQLDYPPQGSKAKNKKYINDRR
jgi:hypothetical protein